MKRIITCDGKCKGCYFEWRNAQYNPDCFLGELIDHIADKSDNISWDVKNEET